MPKHCAQGIAQVFPMCGPNSHSLPQKRLLKCIHKLSKQQVFLFIVGYAALWGTICGAGIELVCCMQGKSFGPCNISLALFFFKTEYYLCEYYNSRDISSLFIIRRHLGFLSLMHTVNTHVAFLSCTVPWMELKISDLQGPVFCL